MTKKKYLVINKNFFYLLKVLQVFYISLIHTQHMQGKQESFSFSQIERKELLKTQVQDLYNHDLKIKIWIVDAFANKPFLGNQAAVIIIDEFPSDQVCKTIAAEMNLSQTVFLKKLQTNNFHIRWFTPKVEVELCGHATLASAHVLNQQRYIQGNDITFQSLSGPLKVLVSSSNDYTLDFPLQKTGIKLQSNVIKQCFSQIVEAVQAHDDIIIELESEEKIYNYIPQVDKLKKIECRGVIITAKGKKKYDFVSRFFGPRVGIDEDPVTGSAHCKLAHYWQQKLGKNQFQAYQASKRGGEIQIKVKGERVHLTGKAVTILKGNFINF